MRVVVGLCILVVASAAFAATPPTAPYIETFDVRVNSIDVVVTDRHGNRIAGLGKDDFDVFENNVPQPVTNFSEYSAGTMEHPLQPVPAQAGAPSGSPVTRKFVFLVDDMSLHPQTRRTLKRSIAELIASTMHDGDEAMIVTPASAHDRVPLPFTADRALLLQRLDAMIDANFFRADSQIGFIQRSLESRDNGLFATTLPDNSSQRVRVTLGHIQSIVSAMAEVPGKKTMVLITEWLPAVPGYRGAGSTAVTDVSGRITSTSTDLRPLLNAIARTASTNGIAIYCLQPEYGLALAVPGPDVASNVRVSDSLTVGTLISNTETTMQMLSEKTGASWSHRSGSFFNNLRHDLSSYYSIGYRPTSTVTNQTRRIDVRVKGRRDLRVRTRREVMQKSTTDEMDERVVGHLIYPNDVDELGVTTTLGKPRRERNTMLIPVSVDIPIANLTLLPEGDKYRGSFTVHYATSGAGDFSSGVERQQVVEIPAADIEAARGHAWTFTSDLRVRPGKIDIAVGVLDPISRLTSFKTLTVEAR